MELNPETMARAHQRAVRTRKPAIYFRADGKARVAICDQPRDRVGRRQIGDIEWLHIRGAAIDYVRRFNARVK